LDVDYLDVIGGLSLGDCAGLLGGIFCQSLDYTHGAMPALVCQGVLFHICECFALKNGCFGPSDVGFCYQAGGAIFRSVAG